MGSAEGPLGLVSQPSPGWVGDQGDHSIRWMLRLVSVRAPVPGQLLA